MCKDFPDVSRTTNRGLMVNWTQVSCFLCVPRVSKVSGGCQIELRLVVVEMTEENVKTELKCITQNQGGRQEVVAQFQLEGKIGNMTILHTPT